MPLSEEVKSQLEIKGDVLKSIVNDLNSDRTVIISSIVDGVSTDDNLHSVSSLENLIRMLMSYKSLLDRQ